MPVIQVPGRVYLKPANTSHALPDPCRGLLALLVRET
jgi:hypothetical protein